MEYPTMLGAYALCAVMPFYVIENELRPADGRLFEGFIRVVEILASYVVLTFSFNLEAWSISLFYLDSLYYSGIIISMTSVCFYLSPWFHVKDQLQQRKIKYSNLFIFYFGLFLATGSALILVACLLLMGFLIRLLHSKLDFTPSMPIELNKPREGAGP